MQTRRLLVVGVFVLGIAIGLVGSQMLPAQDPLKTGTILKRIDLSFAEGWEAMLVDRPLPAGVESGRHTQSGIEIVYIAEGSVIVQVEGKPDETVEAGAAFTTSAGDVHNVKNASDSGPARALAFYIAKKGATLEDLAVPAE